jgi:DNA-binding MarR family transcriptional regulator
MAKQFDYLMRGLLHAFYWMDESLQNHLRASGWPRVSRTQSMIMVNVSDGITRPVDLARNLGISRQAVQQVLADMEEQGLITLVPDPDDARAKIVRFSPRGKGIVDAALRAIASIERELEKRLGKQLFVQLKRALLERDWGEVVDPSRTSEKTRPSSSRRVSARRRA